MFTLPQLGYAYDALEPHIDAKTMEIHYTKHHATYVDKLNEALKDRPDLLNGSLEQLFESFAALPPELQTPVKNHGGGHHNHSLFWEIIRPGGNQPSPAVTAKLEAAFGSFDNFKEQFGAAALNRFGSGWAWLSEKDGALEIHSTANQDSPLLEGRRPILGLDVWEHAYYLKYQNRRPDYVAAWWSVVNWETVGRRLAA